MGGGQGALESEKLAREGRRLGFLITTLRPVQTNISLGKPQITAIFSKHLQATLELHCYCGVTATQIRLGFWGDFAFISLGQRKTLQCLLFLIRFAVSDPAASQGITEISRGNTCRCVLKNSNRTHFHHQSASERGGSYRQGQTKTGNAASL